MPGFRLLIAGDGPDQDLISFGASAPDHVRVLGRVDGDRKVLALDAADLTLMPGLVGLAVLDAFAAQAPMITTAVSFHSPEIEYLEHGRNGWILDELCTPLQYAEWVVTLLKDPALLEQLFSDDSRLSQRLHKRSDGQQLRRRCPKCPRKDANVTARLVRTVFQRLQRTWAVRRNVMVLGKFHVGTGSRLWAPSNLTVGPDVYVGKRCTIEVDGTIGAGVLIGNDVGIVGRRDHDHRSLGVLIRRAPSVDAEFTDHGLHRVRRLGRLRGRHLGTLCDRARSHHWRRCGCRQRCSRIRGRGREPGQVHSSPLRC